jgi:hypothetical protein
LPDELAERAQAYCDEHGISSLQKGIRELLTSSLEEGSVPVDTVNERMAAFEARLDFLAETLSVFAEDQAAIATETQDRLLRTASKGTKASLAGLVALSTYLPPVGNLVDSLSHINMTAWERLGFEIQDQRLAKDQATLLEWRERGPEEFFRFCWSAAGKASRRGAHVDYAELTKGLHEYPFIEDPEAELPSSIVDLYLDEEQLVRKYGEDIAERWLEIREVKRSIDQRIEDEDTNGLDLQYIEQVDKDYQRVLSEIQERSKFSVSKLTTRLVSDPESPSLWREPTDEELVARIKRLSELGITDPLSKATSIVEIARLQEGDISHDWSWFVDNFDDNELIEHLRYRLEQGYAMPGGYDGSFDEEIGE